MPFPARLVPPVLQGDRVRLEPLTQRHAADLALAAEEDRVAYQFTWVPRSEEVPAYIDAQLAKPDVMPLARIAGGRSELRYTGPGGPEIELPRGDVTDGVVRERLALPGLAVTRSELSWRRMRASAERFGGGWARMWSEGVGDLILRRRDWLLTHHDELTAALS